MRRLSDWYAHPEYYEAIFGPDSAKELEFLLGVNAQFGTGGKHWLEPACGAGRLLEEGARRGLKLVGYDLSEQMLDHARRRLKPWARRVQLHKARMEDFAPPALHGKIDLAFSLVSTFRYLDSEEAALQHLRSVRSLLKPDGIYVLGFHISDYARKRPEHERWTGEVNGRSVVCNTREWPPERRARRSKMRNRLLITGGEEEPILIETEWYFRTYDAEQALQLVNNAGFELHALYDFDYQLESPSGLDTDRLDWVMVLKPTS